MEPIGQRGESFFELSTKSFIVPTPSNPKEDTRSDVVLPWAMHRINALLKKVEETTFNSEANCRAWAEFEALVVTASLARDRLKSVDMSPEAVKRRMKHTAKMKRYETKKKRLKAESEANEQTEKGE